MLVGHNYSTASVKHAFNASFKTYLSMKMLEGLQIITRAWALPGANLGVAKESTLMSCSAAILIRTQLLSGTLKNTKEPMDVDM
ncbi:hypothetical protein NQ318_011707 [Aromia moschata]|uniref:Uncharacterized protein n=1 Tax=Aromia moschata TaxID=1265417 RepID=A0AAV8XQ64_9CUCU|nr:hypothetical protein NQ318_011707 [Aromia moschata]